MKIQIKKRAISFVLAFLMTFSVFAGTGAFSFDVKAQDNHFGSTYSDVKSGGTLGLETTDSSVVIYNDYQKVVFTKGNVNFIMTTFVKKNGEWVSLFDSGNAIVGGSYFNCKPTAYTVTENTAESKIVTFSGRKTGAYPYDYTMEISASKDSPLIKFRIVNKLTSKMNLTELSQAPTVLLTMNSAPDDIVKVYQTVTGYQWTPESESKWGNTFPYAYFWTGGIEAGIFFDMAAMDWFDMKNGIRRFNMIQIKTIQDDNTTSIGTYYRNARTAYIEGRDMVIQFYLYANENSEKPTKLQALNRAVKAFGECFPASTPWPTNYVDSEVSYEFFCKKLTAQMLLEGVTYKVDDALTGVTSKPWKDTPAFTEETVTQSFQRPSYAAAEGFSAPSSFSTEWNCTNNAVPVITAFERLFPDTTTRDIMNRNTNALKLYYDDKGKFIYSFINTGFHGTSTANFVFQNFFFGMFTQITAMMRDPAEFDPGISGTYLKALDGIVAVGRNNNYILPQLFDGATKMPHKSVDEAWLGYTHEPWAIGIYAYDMCMAYEYTGDITYLNEAKRGAEVLFTGATYSTRENTSFTYTYTDPYDFGVNESSSAPWGVAACQYLYEKTGDKKYLEYSDYFRDFSLRLMYWFESNLYSDKIDQAIGSAGLFNAFANAVSSTPWECMYSYLPFLSELQNEEIEQSQLLLKMFNVFRTNFFYFTGVTWDPDAISYADAYQKASTNYLVCEDYYSPERGNTMGWCGPTPYMSNSTYYAYYMYEAFSETTDRDILALNLDVLTDSYNMINGVARRFVYFNPTDVNKSVTIKMKNLQDCNYVVDITYADGTKETVTKSADALTEGIPMTIGAGDYIRINITATGSVKTTYDNIYEAQRVISNAYTEIQNAAERTSVDTISSYKTAYTAALALYDEGKYSEAISKINAIFPQLKNTVPDNVYSVSAEINEEYDATVKISGNNITSYQVWANLTYDDNNNWTLVKEYDAADNGDMSYTFNIPMENRTKNGVYSFYVKLKSGTVLVHQEQISASVPEVRLAIESFAVNGSVLNTNEAFITEDIASIFETKANSETAMYEYSIAVTGSEKFTTIGGIDYIRYTPQDSGIYTLRVKVYNKHNPLNCATRDIRLTVYGSVTPNVTINTTNVFSNGDTINQGEKLGINLNSKIDIVNSATPYYKMTVGEQNRNPFWTSDFTLSPTASFTAQYPGVYTVGAYVAANTTDTYTDGVINKFTVLRNDGKNVYANFSVSGATSSNNDTVSIGDKIKITVNGKGLDSKDDYQYSFWRVDASGTRLIRDWSSSNTITWTPAKIGNYKIYARVRGAYDNNGDPIPKGAGTYEYEIPFIYTVNGTEPITGLTASTSTQSGESTERIPILITASNATSKSGNVLYKFSVYDEFMGEIILSKFSPKNTCTWIPRKAGKYTIKVSAIDSLSFGTGEATTEIKDFIVTSSADVEATGAIWDSFAAPQLWSGPAEIKAASSGAGATITKTSTGNYVSRTFTVDIDTYPLIELVVSSISNASLHVTVSDGTESHYLTDTNSFIYNAPGRNSAGTFRLNLKQMSGWSGEKTFTVNIYVDSTGIGANLTVQSIKSLEYSPATVNETLSASSPVGIWRYRDIPSGGISYTDDGLTITGGAGRTWKTLAINVDKYPYIDVTISSRSNSGSLIVLLNDNNGAADIFGPSLSAPGTHRVNVKELTGWKGNKIITFNLALNGGSNASEISVSKLEAIEDPNYVPSDFAFEIDMYNSSAWSVEGDVIVEDDITGMYIQGSFGRAYYSTNFDYNVTDYPYIVVVTDGIFSDDSETFGLYLILNNGSGDQFIKYDIDTAGSGSAYKMNHGERTKYVFYLPNSVTWSGQQSIKVQLVVETGQFMYGNIREVYASNSDK